MTAATQNRFRAIGNQTEIPEVFTRMPLELLRRYAQHGVTGAKDEMRRRRTEEKTAAPPKAVEPETEKA